ncbi:hypothetical protein JM83_1987 [Gillisia sp. Hel_I_86]|uniref:hypothetical protein n=1 Tax=Gillisia sp. Hel_I_86 TaxID=1249981 RepID=UPI00119A5CE8|nr:hypothetical protein [Gillisia sp. Hel_I_86]TVZ26980.1 hypothetical protein JM83_1987 [Gillisia sp. Hel_I_86]
MKKTYLIFALLLGICLTSLGQNLNSYKYVVVPDRFDFLKEPNQYQMNELAKFLFEKYGFTAFMASESKPSDLSMDSCNVLYADVIEDSGLFQTKLQVLLKDCRNQVVFTSEEGKSKEKDFKQAYQEALRNAFNYVEAINYKYDGNSAKVKEEVPETQIRNIPGPAKEIKQEGKVEEVIVSAIPKKIQKETKVLERVSNKRSYFSGELEVYLLQTEYGFQLVQKEMEEPFGKLVKTGSANHFIYSTLQNTGIAFFDESGNLNVEILTENGNTTSTKIYKLKN